MIPPDTTFPKPEFDLVPDHAARFYANVDNRLQRYYRDGRCREVLVQVPTALFTLMRDVFHIDPADTVTMYIAPEGQYYVFGISWGESSSGVTDLWYYPAASLPSFLR